MGRFPVHWSPSRDFGLALSDAVPYHNAVQTVLKFPRLKYRFLVSSFNPWLEGTPPGDSSGSNFPVGSAQWRQRHYPVAPGSENNHKRVYAEPIKTLIAHRLETWAGPDSIGLTETAIIAGKAPDLRDVNPYAVFHNEFHEGHDNNNVSLDAAVKLPLGLLLSAELFMDDLEWSETETRGATPSLLGYLAALRHSFPAGRWAVSHNIHAVRTTPFLYGYMPPLNTYVSRHILTSNHQRPGDARFVDKYVIDYPLGYLRGGDALDVWYRAEAMRGRFLRIAASAALLARGENGTDRPFEDYFLPHGSSPSGRVENELRLSTDCQWRSGNGLGLAGGVMIRRLESGARPNRDGWNALYSLGASWVLMP